MRADTRVIEKAGELLISHTQSLKERQRQEREDLILQAAGDVLLEKGYRDTSMDEIAARVGIAKGTLYLHFAKKEDLVFAFLERVLQEVVQTIEEARMLSCSAQERLWAVAHALYREPYGRRRACFFYLLLDSEEFRARGRETSDDMLKRIHDVLASLLEEGKARGEFDAALPTNIMVDTFFSVLSPRAHNRLAGGSQLSSQDVLRSTGRIYFRGIGACLPDHD